MEVTQLYETAIYDRQGDTGLHILVAPTRSLLAPSDYTEGAGTQGHLQSLSRLLEVELLQEIPSPTLLPHALAVAMLDTGGSREAADLLRLLLAIPQPVRAYPGIAINGSAAALAEYVAFAKIIPMEQSPLEAESLASLAVSNAAKIGGGAGLGASIALMAFGASPFVIFAVPTAIVLCVAAPAVGQAAGDLGATALDVLRVKLLRAAGVPRAEALEELKERQRAGAKANPQAVVQGETQEVGWAATASAPAGSTRSQVGGQAQGVAQQAQGAMTAQQTASQAGAQTSPAGQQVQQAASQVKEPAQGAAQQAQGTVARRGR